MGTRPGSAGPPGGVAVVLGDGEPMSIVAGAGAAPAGDLTDPDDDSHAPTHPSAAAGADPHPAHPGRGR